MVILVSWPRGLPLGLTNGCMVFVVAVLALLSGEMATAIEAATGAAMEPPDPALALGIGAMTEPPERQGTEATHEPVVGVVLCVFEAAEDLGDKASTARLDDCAETGADKFGCGAGAVRGDTAETDVLEEFGGDMIDFRGDAASLGARVEQDDGDNSQLPCKLLQDVALFRCSVHCVVSRLKRGERNADTDAT